jgi:predicted metal-dependent hydrolase
LLSRFFKSTQPSFAYPLKVIKSARRKSVAISVYNREIIVRTPAGSGQRLIDQALARHADWIRRQIIRDQTREPVPERKYLPGETFSFLGSSYPLEIDAGQNNPLSLSNGCFHIGFKNGPAQEKHTVILRRRFIAWYRQQALAYLDERLQSLISRTGLAPTGIRVRAYRSRWGSCSIRGIISLNWKLMMAPPEVIDYVIVHELCHLAHLNHSRSFWNLVEKHMPDYKTHKTWLKDFGASLDL